MKKYVALFVTVGLLAACGSAPGSPAASGSSGTAASPSPAASGTSTSTGSETGVAEAQRLLATDEAKLSDWPAPGPAFDAKGASGKLIWYISGDESSEFEHHLVQGMTEASAVVGAKYTAVDGKGQVSEYARAVEEGIAQHAGVIILGGVQPAAIGPQLADAKAAGIPVIAGHLMNPGEPTPQPNDAVVAFASHCPACQGRQLAHFMVADSGGNANAVIFTVTAFGPVIAGEVKNIEQESSRLCPQCKTKTVDVLVTQLNDVGSLASSQLRQDPTINYLIPAYDQLALFMVPAVHQLGLQDKVKVLSTNATPGALKFVAQHDVLAADAGEPDVWQGWGFADQAFRVLTGTAPVDDIKTPYRLFDWNNVGSLDLNATDDSTRYWEGDYRSVYKKMWGM
jgi:ribose transport system substrate-binding protein